MSTTSQLCLILSEQSLAEESVPLENYVCREVIEDFFFKEKPFSQTRHVIVTVIVVFSTMGSKLSPP